MIVGEIPLENILQIYEEVKRENVVLMLMRCKRLFDARVEAKRIIHNLIMLDDLLNQ